MLSKWLSEKENLYQLIVIQKLSYEKIGLIYGCSGTNIKNVAIRLGIPVTQRRKVNPKENFGKGIIKVPLTNCLNCGNEFRVYAGSFGKYCCCQCRHEHYHKLKYQDFLENPEKYNRADYSPSGFKKDFLKEQNYKCAICGMTPQWNGKQLVFILDHIDGHAAHNYRNNLRLICPNCDSQLDTYKSKNKCSDRKYRYNRNKIEE